MVAFVHLTVSIWCFVVPSRFYAHISHISVSAFGSLIRLVHSSPPSALSQILSTRRPPTSRPPGKRLVVQHAPQARDQYDSEPIAGLCLALFPDATLPTQFCGEGLQAARHVPQDSRAKSIDAARITFVPSRHYPSPSRSVSSAER